MAYSNLVSTEYIYKNSIIDNSLDAKILTTLIRQASDMHIQTAIGNSLYVHIMNNILADGTTNLTGDYITLLKDYIQPALCQWVVALSIPYVNYRLTNKAVSQKNSEYSNASGLDEVKWMEGKTRETAEFYTQRIIDYIKLNKNSFPQYVIVGENGIDAEKTGYNMGGFYLGGKRSGCGPIAGVPWYYDRDNDCGC